MLSVVPLSLGLFVGCDPLPQFQRQLLLQRAEKWNLVRSCYPVCDFGKVPTSIITSDPALRHSVPETYPGQLLPLTPLPPAPPRTSPFLHLALPPVWEGTLKACRNRVGVGDIVLAFEHWGRGGENPLSPT